MPATQPIKLLLPRLWCHISRRRRKQFGLLTLLVLLASFAEIISIGAILPFLGVLTVPERVFQHPIAQPLIQSLGLASPMQLLLPITLVFGVATIYAGLMRLMLVWANTRLSFAMGADLGIDIYRRTLYQPYSVHCARNSSEVISGISNKASGVIYNTILPLMTLISASVMLIAILAALLLIEPIIAVFAFGGFGLIYTSIIKLTSNQISTDSERIAYETVQVIKSLQEGLGGIRDVLIDGSQEVYCQTYLKADRPLRIAQGNSVFISASPRYGMEALGMLLITTLAYTLTQQPGGIGKAIPILGALAIGAQRLLPVLQQAYGAWVAIQGSRAALQDTIELLEQPLPWYADKPITKPLLFNNNIRLNEVSFRHGKDTKNILDKASLNIAKGDRIGVIGVTGSGKSTLLDIIMGLLIPTDGALEVDGQPIDASNYRAWQAHIAHVPQSIFLADSTVKENIAFGIPKDMIDLERVRRAAQQAQIAESIEAWSEKYDTHVGERGVRISGGQRQRIGIARALYKQADVIIFDEATSALDNETEQAVMQSIEKLNKSLTVIIVAHRITTLRECTQIVELDGGKIKRTGSFEEITAQSNQVSSV